MSALLIFSKSLKFYIVVCHISLTIIDLGDADSNLGQGSWKIIVVHSNVYKVIIWLHHLWGWTGATPLKGRKLYNINSSIIKAASLFSLSSKEEKQYQRRRQHITAWWTNTISILFSPFLQEISCQIRWSNTKLNNIMHDSCTMQELLGKACSHAW